MDLAMMIVLLLLIANNLTTVMATSLTNEKKKHDLGIPPNAHGVEAKVLIAEEQQLTKGDLITTIPTLSTEWSLSFDIRIFEIPSSSYCNIICLNGNTGRRLPEMFLMVNGEFQTEFTGEFDATPPPRINYKPDISIGVSMNIGVIKRYMGAGLYTMVFVVGGNEVAHTTDINESRLYHNTNVYAANPWNNACNATISNFKHTNFF